MALPQDDSARRRLDGLERQIRSLRRRYEQLRSPRSTSAHNLDLRLAKTVGSTDDTPAYPVPDASTYRVEFQDSHFTKAAGWEIATHTPRGEQLYAHDLYSGWIPENWPVWCARLRGLGGQGKGDWWIVAGQKTRYKGAVTEYAGITAGSSGEVTLWLDTQQTTYTVEAWHIWMAGNSTAGFLDEVIVEWFRDEQKWYITELEC